MTIEVSLRKRAQKCRLLSWTYILIALSFCAFGFLTITTSVKSWKTSEFDSPETTTNIQSAEQLPDVAAYLSNSAFSASTLVLLGGHLLILAIIAIAAFLLFRVAFQETFLSIRYESIADALVLAKGNIEELDKAVTIMVPRGKNLVRNDVFSAKEIKAVTDLIKNTKA